MNKRIQILLFLVISTSKLPLISQISPLYHMDFSLYKSNRLSPSDWFHNYYLNVSDESERNDLRIFLEEFSCQAKRGSIELEKLFKQLIEGVYFSETSAKILEVMNLSCELSNLKTWEGGAAFRMAMELFTIPSTEGDHALDTRQDFIDAMPEMLELFAVIIKQTNDCLKLINENK